MITIYDKILFIYIMCEIITIISKCGFQIDVSDLAWSPDGSMLATGSFDSTIIIWETETFGITINHHLIHSIRKNSYYNFTY